MLFTLLYFNNDRNVRDGHGDRGVHGDHDAHSIVLEEHILADTSVGPEVAGILVASSVLTDGGYGDESVLPDDDL